MTGWRHEKRAIGATGVAVTRLGFGAAPLGNLFAPITDDAASDCVAAALSARIGYFDTAPHYGFGLSERRLGADLNGASPVISTKVGRRLDPAAGPSTAMGFVGADPFISVFDYSGDAAERTLMDSLTRLQRTRIEIVFVHDLGRVVHGDAHPARLCEALDGVFPRLLDLKAQGLIDAIGLGVNEYQIADEIMDRVPLDAVLLAGRHTLIDRSAARVGFLDRCASAGTALIMGGVFNSGLLADPFAASPRFDYAAAPPRTIARARTMAAACVRHGSALGAAAVQFPSRHAATASVVVGARSAAQLGEIVAWADMPVPDALWAELEEL